METQKIRFTLTTRRFRLDPIRKRQEYIERLETLVAQLDAMLVDPRLSRKLKLRTMEVLIKTVNSCYNMVGDIEVESLEEELEKIKEENQREREDKTLPYTIQEDPAH